MVIDMEHFKKMLIKEKATLESELETVGRKNPDNVADWEAVEPQLNVDAAEDGEVAEGIEQYENNSAVLDQLETQLKEVKVALQKIEDEKYGMCEVDGEQIELDRLEANPSAKTCKAHMNM